MSRITLDGILGNATLANSQWTADVFATAYGVRPQVMYPPVVSPPAGLSWEERQTRFLCYGRLSPEKRYEVIIDIVERLRGHGHDVGLTIVGSPWSADYRRAVLDRVAAAGPWVELNESPDRAALFELIGTHRYGIHANPEEHFGLAAAEMACGGCVVFVPDGGGQVEIVDRNPHLLWCSPDEAVSRIDAVLRSSQLQHELRLALAEHGRRFGTERFMGEMRAAVETFIARRAAGRHTDREGDRASR